MSTEQAKIRIKMGQLEIEFEGSESFLGDGIFNLLDRAVDFYKANETVIPAEKTVASTQKVDAHSVQLDHSTNTIAAHLDVKTGTDLAIAAAGHLILVKNADKFSRKELLEEMKGATTYYKSTMGSNLTKSLDTLVKAKRFNQISKDIYSLSASEKSNLEPKLA